MIVTCCDIADFAYSSGSWPFDAKAQLGMGTGQYWSAVKFGGATLIMCVTCTGYLRRREMSWVEIASGARRR